MKSIRSEQYKEPGDADILRYFIGLMGLMATVPMAIAMPFLSSIENNFKINSIGYEICMGATIISFLYYLVQISSINDETLNYFAKPFHRYDINLKRVKKFLLIGVCVIITISLLDELYYRKHWIIWGETIALFIISSTILFMFGKVLFMPCLTENERPDRLYMPSVKNVKTIGIVIFLIIFAIVCAAISVGGKS